MTAYEFQCPECRKAYLLLLDHRSDDLSHQDCEVCGAAMNRVFGATIGYIDWVNPERGDGINLGLGGIREGGRLRNFKSAAEREDYAKSRGLEKVER